jgi:hypothetical protein
MTEGGELQLRAAEAAEELEGARLRSALEQRADMYEKDGKPGPLASWGWSDVAKELRAVAREIR